MKKLAVEDFNDFECIGSECPICCCGGGWTITIDNETWKYYQSVEGEFGDELRSRIVEKDGNARFLLDGKKDCPFLNEQKLCRIYRTLGEDKMCQTCKTYPRGVLKIGDITFYRLTTSCPEVTRRVMERTEPLQIDFLETKPSKMEELQLKKLKIDWRYFNSAIRVYTNGMGVLQNRNLKIRERAALLMVFLKQFQDMTAQKADTSDLISLFSPEGNYPLLLSDITFGNADPGLKIRALSMVFRILLKMTYDHPMYERINRLMETMQKERDFGNWDLNASFRRMRLEERETELEQLFCFRYFSNFAKGFEEKDYYEQMVYEIVMIEALDAYQAMTEAVLGEECTREDRILFYSVCSRIDHGQMWDEEMKEQIRNADLYDLGMVFRLLG